MSFLFGKLDKIDSIVKKANCKYCLHNESLVVIDIKTRADEVHMITCKCVFCGLENIFWLNEGE